MHRIWLVFIGLLSIALVLVPLVQAGSQNVTLAPGDSLSVRCDTRLSGNIGKNKATLNCAPKEATPTSTSTPMSTLTPTPDTGHGATGVCGESMDVWHPPVINGCATGHEHGDAPPQWIEAAGFHASFMGHFNTPNENVRKHPAMKGFLAHFNSGVDLYFRVHAASNVLDRSARFHSYEVFARDPAGRVSHWQGWYNSGNPDPNYINPETGVSERPTKLEQEGHANSRTTIIGVDQASRDANLGCEQWYATTAEWSWDFGWTICDSTTFYYKGENAQQDQSNWRLTGSTGTARRLEASWFGPNSQFAQNRGEPPKDVTFWATQFGDIVSGPNDPRCSGNVTQFGQTFQAMCLDQFIASTMRSVESPNNAIEKNFPNTGVRIPN